MPPHLRLAACCSTLLVILLVQGTAVAATPPNVVDTTGPPARDAVQPRADQDLVGVIRSLAPDVTELPSVALLISIGHRALRAGDLDVAERAAQAALGFDGRDPDGHTLLGEVYWRLGWRDSALACFRTALACDAGAGDAQFRLVTCLAAAGQAREAERQCREFLGAGDTAPLLVALGETQEKLGRSKDAFGSYGQAQALDPNLATVYSHRAGLLCRMHQYDAAKQACHEALTLDPEDALAHAYLAVACGHQQNYLDAYSHAAKAERAGVDVREVWDLLRGNDQP